MDNFTRLRTFDASLENSSKAINNNYDLYIQGIKEILEELRKPKSTKIDLWTILCWNSGEKDALYELNNLIPYDVAGTEKKDFPIVIDPKNNNQVVRVLSNYQFNMRKAIAIWYALTSTDFNEVEIEGGKTPPDLNLNRVKGFSTLKNGLNCTLMFPLWKRIFCKHDYRMESMYVKMIGPHDYPEYKLVDVCRCVKCGNIESMQFN